MRIIYISPDFPIRGTPTTGFPNYLKRVTSFLVRFGHEPLIIYASSYYYHRIINGVEYIGIPTIAWESVKNEISIIDYYMLRSFILCQYLNENEDELKADIIQFTSIQGCGLFYQGRVPSVLRLSSYAKTYFGTYSTYEKEFVDSLARIERLSSINCDEVFAPCQITAHDFGVDIKRYVSVIETPFVDFNSTGSNMDDVIPCEVLNEKKYVLFFGKLYAEKGILVIASILEEFLKSNQDYYFLAVGEDSVIEGISAHDYIKKSAGSCSDRVLVLDAMPHNKLFSFIKMADYIILPSIMENLSNSCIEAMNYGKVVIGTDGTSFEQLIADGVNGFLCLPNNPQDLLKKMNHVSSLRKEEKTSIGKEAAKRIVPLKDGTVIRELLDYYCKVIEENEKKDRILIEDIEIERKRIKFLYDEIESKKNSTLQLQYDKAMDYAHLLGRWVDNLNEGIRLSDYIKKYGYKSVSIYGLSDIGRKVIKELTNDGITISYVIDRNQAIFTSDIPLFKPKERLPEVDVVIVTPVNQYEDIKQSLIEYISAPIVSLEDIVFGEDM